jgi:hypothetical protein
MGGGTFVVNDPLSRVQGENNEEEEDASFEWQN